MAHLRGDAARRSEKTKEEEGGRRGAVGLDAGSSCSLIGAMARHGGRHVAPDTPSKAGGEEG